MTTGLLSQTGNKYKEDSFHLIFLTYFSLDSCSLFIHSLSDGKKYKRKNKKEKPRDEAVIFRERENKRKLKLEQKEK